MKNPAMTGMMYNVEQSVLRSIGCHIKNDQELRLLVEITGEFGSTADIS
jgi:hypothetical protein